MGIELKDLSPAYQAQALRKLAQARERPKPGGTRRPTISVAGREFDSRGEYEFYMGTVVPGIQAGTILECRTHQAFQLFPESEYNGVKLRSVRYTPDFVLHFADGTTEVVEVKSKFVRRMQRDYALRRRIFLEQVARPNGWRFREVITGDTKEEVKQWRMAANGGKRNEQSTV